MQIISSSIILQNVQVDGRIVVREKLGDDQGNVYLNDYMTVVGANAIALTQHLASTVTSYNAQFAFNAANAVPIAQSVVDNLNGQISLLQAELFTAQTVLTTVQAANPVQAQVL